MNHFIFLHSLSLALLLLAFTPLGFAAPANDNLAAAIAIDTLPFSQQQDITDATNESSEQLPTCLNEGSASVWYQYTATSEQTVLFNTFDSDYDTVLSVWMGGDEHPLTQVACNDDSNNLKQSQVQLELQMGTTYYLNISGYQGETGTLALTALAINPLANDDLVDALPITLDANASYSYTQTTQGATTQENEAISVCDSKSGGSVWYQYTASTDQTLIIDTLESDYNTVLSVWRGDAYPLEEIICNDDNNGLQSLLRVALTAGETYLINVSAGESPGAGSLFEDTGLLVLNISAPPDNDYLNTAIEITEPLPYTNTQFTSGATVEIGESFPSCDPTASASVWYLLTPTTDYSHVVFSTIGSSYDTVLSIWEGSDHPLNELACNDNATTFEEQSNSSQVTIPLTENLTYYIDVSGVNNGMGQLALNIAEGEPDFSIGSQPQPQTIEVCDSANLVIGLKNKAGEEIETTDNPIGSQWETGVILPFMYQWYQGDSGDDSLLIAEIENNPVFNPTPKTTTQYWARITNPTGSMDSDSAIVTVNGDSETNCEPEIPEQTNGIGLDIDNNQIPTTAHFEGLVALLDDNQPITLVNEADDISVSFKITVDANHVGELVEILMLATYTIEASYSYMRQNEVQWIRWEDDNLANLIATETIQATEHLDITVYQGHLNQMPGLFTIHVGYRLNDGRLFYSGEPIIFTVE